ncbi:HAD superfamily hydrolase (TIGR01509 family) [Aliiruegeria haliotis]|uniref:HAD superfamily hydrolase (TIGR01509 family) n=1 Tax=Aliiruegeria haliotis TaxID=1280846 RepID=A0A2T0RW59_9RHOB|nr:HAD-IA family hydrolase [Aliiruegeria haliotis]PRY25390.1 HAD superfamily hydrolase (TIGR01509 family) [Aliiruegeria haliotis]
MKALIFDVDGTLAETEDAHRRAFNAAFAEHGLAWHWDEELNQELLAVSGGFERMSTYQSRLPATARASDDLLRAVHRSKRRHYTDLLSGGALPLRPGVRDLITAGRAEGMRLAVVTAATRESLKALFAGCFGTPAEALFDLVLTGDDVARKKPDPEGYLLALARLGMAPGEVMVFEDSRVGYAAARAAGVPVVVTPSEHGPPVGDLEGALAVLPSLAREHWPRFGFPPAA